jgi:putative membrane protein
MSRLLTAACFGAFLGLVTLTAARADDKTRAFDDIGFAQFAANANHLEIKAGKLAKEQATNDDVRRFAEHMVKDHTDAQEQLKRVAAAMDISLPMALPKEKMEACERLAKLRGSDFDQAYIGEMVKGHEKVLERFTLATKEAKNERLRGYAEKTLPTIKEHLEQARKIKTSLGGRSR